MKEGAPGLLIVTHGRLADELERLVRESVDEVTEKVIEYRKKVNSQAKAVNPIQGFERT